MKYVVEFVPV